jgi:hypothetical protein
MAASSEYTVDPRPANLREVTQEQERIAILLREADIARFVHEPHEVDLLCAVQAAIPSGREAVRRAIDEQLYQWAESYDSRHASESTLDIICDPGSMFVVREQRNGDDQEYNYWYLGCCRRELSEWHSPDCALSG